MKEIINPDSASSIELNENKIHFQNEYQYNTYICSIPMDFASVPVHWHDEFEMIVIKKGRGYVTLNFQRYKVSSGHCSQGKFTQSSTFIHACPTIRKFTI